MTSFVMIRPVVEDNYASGFDGRTLYHTHRSLCEPGTDYIVTAKGPESDPLRILTHGRLSTEEFQTGLRQQPERILPPGFIPSFAFAESTFERRVS